MNIKYIFNCLRDIHKIYSNFILSSNFCRSNQIITWDQYKPGIYNKILYAREYEQLIKERQYSFLLVDKSFFQFYYEFSDDSMKKAKLAYYPYPIANQEDGEALEEYFCDSGTDILEAYYLGLKGLQEIGIVSTNNSHFRLDYDCEADSHSKSHAQYSGINNLRIPFEQVISPILFFEFILKNTFENYSLKKEEIENSSSYKYALPTALEKIKNYPVENGFRLKYKP